jgi:L-amino acid N-acyltransferase YncA
VKVLTPGRAPVTSAAMELRLARVGDAEATRAIYNTAVGTLATFDLRPRTLAEQEAWLLARSGAHAALVAVESTVERLPGGGERTIEDVIGFGSLSSYRDRPAYATTVEDSVYVRADQRGKGVGRLLLDGLLDVAVGHGFHCVIARIVADNEPSIALHRAAGFDLIGTEREVGRKFRRWLDVVELQLLLTTSEPDD